MLSQLGVRNVSPIPGIALYGKLKYKRAEGAAGGPSIQTATQGRRKEHPATDTTNRNSKENMQLSSISVLGLLLLLNLQQFSAHPISPGLTENDMDTLRVSL